MKITSISPSGLQLYADCSRCFLLKMQKRPFVGSAAMTFGSRLHKVIELYHKTDLLEADEDLQPYLEAYMNEYTRDFDVAEEFWKVPLFDTGIMLSTKVDLIKDNILIDHKTSSYIYSQEYIDNHAQMTAYAYAWSQKYTEPPDAIRFNLFLTNPKAGDDLLQVLNTQRTDEHIEEWRNWVGDILLGIESDWFEPQKAKWHNYSECPMYKEKDGETD